MTGPTAPKEPKPRKPPSFSKRKGREAQNKVRELILAHLNLDPDDVKCALMGESGADIKLSKAARELFDYSVEVKWREKINVWDGIACAKQRKGEPMFCFKRSRSEMFAVVRLEHLLDLIKQAMANG